MREEFPCYSKLNSKKIPLYGHLFIILITKSVFRVFDTLGVR